ncbi:NosD domain-containing protein [Nocardioides alcanivorans]|uniref:NosD domain-containing protein n=1 Tax=Nocardioides alcanivorans TaxID=2897352 RepID=UPI001F2D65AE|nr:NosD domain-containing protein [Nocardioides alcanivorans]
MPFRLRPVAQVAALLLTAGVLAGCGSDDKAADAPVETQPVVHVPADAATISEAMDKVAEDGLVLVSAGTYAEEVLVNVPGVTLRGADRNGVVITGEGTRTAGVIAIADGVRVENLTVTDTLLYGVLVTGTHDGDEALTPAQTGYDEFDPERFPPLQRFAVDHVTATNNGLYGIYAFNTQHGTITNSWASGSADSGFYVGQCRDCDIVVSDNVATRNAVGFENANASDSLTIVRNRFSDNRVGLTLTSNYQEAFVPQKGNLVAGNVISDNSDADSPLQADGGYGIGVGIAGGQDNTLLRNLISGNINAGVIVQNAEDVVSSGNTLQDNTFTDNRADVVNLSLEAYPASNTCLKGPDVATLLLHPADFGLSCTADPDPAAAPLKALTVPDGVSFLEVTKPGDLPSLPASDDVPERLPDTVEHPDIDAVKTPKPSLLADLG